jgi:protein-tyrosine kinase
MEAAKVQNNQIGHIISVANNLSAEQVEQVLAYQRQHGVRFGEAAVALSLVGNEDVVWALSQQYQYPYVHSKSSGLSDEILSAKAPFSAEAEKFRDLRSQIIMRLGPPPKGRCQPIAVLSTERADGKSFFAANLAATFAQLGGRVLLVDGDLRNSRQHEIFGLNIEFTGLSEALSGRSAAQVYVPAPDLPNLFLLPAGNTPPNPLELVERPAFASLLAELSSKFDHVFVDTPAAAVGTDSAVIASRCGAALILARKDVSRQGELRRLMDSCRIGKVDVVGLMVNDH